MRFLCKMCGSKWDADTAPSECLACGAAMVERDPEELRAEQEAKERRCRLRREKTERDRVKAAAEEYFANDFRSDESANAELADIKKLAPAEFVACYSRMASASGDEDSREDVKLFVRIDDKEWPVICVAMPEITSGLIFKRKKKVMLCVVSPEIKDVEVGLSLREVRELLMGCGVKKLSYDVTGIAVAVSVEVNGSKRSRANRKREFLFDWDVVSVSFNQGRKIMVLDAENKILKMFS